MAVLNKLDETKGSSVISPGSLDPSPLKNKKLLVFDWDGTLIDSVNRIVTCFQLSFHQMGLPTPKPLAIRNTIGLPLEEAFDALTGGGKGQDRFVAVYRDFWLSGKLPLSSLFPGVPGMLQNFFLENYRLAVATGKSRVGLEREQNHHHIDQFFSASRCARETAAKPHPEMLIQIMRETGFSAEETLMVGDSPLDLNMARAAGVQAVAVTTGSDARASLEACQPITCLDDVTGLPQLLNP